MKKWINIFLLLTLVTIPFSAEAIEFVNIDTRGYRNFRCGTAGRGAKISIKELRNDRFQVLSKPYSGIMHLPKDLDGDRWCTGLRGAVRILCGLCDWPNTDSKLEYRKKQLGIQNVE